jgi:phage portal protein BeeE
MTPDVLQFLESREFNILEIARFLGLPPSKLFDIKGQNYNSQEQSNLEVATDTLDAWTKNLEIEADIKLLNKRFGGRRTEMDLYEIFRGDMTTRANYFSKMMQAGAITPNQIRMKEGLAPYEGGDRYWIAVNNFSPADRVDEIIDSQITKNEPQPARQPETQNQQEAELTNAAIRYLTRK